MSHEGKGESKEVVANRERILENKKKLFTLEHSISSNSATFLLTRAGIQENRDLISRNYDAAFHGNFHSALGNLESIYRNRLTYLRNLKADTSVQTNFKDASINFAKLQLLDVRSKANSRLLTVSAKMAALNTQLLELNAEIMAINQELVDFNSGEIAKNSEMFDKPTLAALTTATPETNATMIAANAAKITELTARAEENAKKDAEIRAAHSTNRERIEANTKAIYERRAHVKRNLELITANTLKLLATFK